MTRVPDMTKTTPIRRRRHLRTHHDALINSSTRQKLKTTTNYRANHANVKKPTPALGTLRPVQRVWQIRVKALAPRQSP
jgi:hypothetical protein